MSSKCQGHREVWEKAGGNNFSVSRQILSGLRFNIERKQFSKLLVNACGLSFLIVSLSRDLTETLIRGLHSLICNGYTSVCCPIN